MVEVACIEDDLTNLLVDYRKLDDLSPLQRYLYMEKVLSLTHQGSLFLLFCFGWELRWWERPFKNRTGLAMEPGEVECCFGDHFEIERVAGGKTSSRLIPATSTYLMTKNTGKTV